MVCWRNHRRIETPYAELFWVNDDFSGNWLRRRVRCWTSMTRRWWCCLEGASLVKWRKYGVLKEVGGKILYLLAGDLMSCMYVGNSTWKIVQGDWVMAGKCVVREWWVLPSVIDTSWWFVYGGSLLYGMRHSMWILCLWEWGRDRGGCWWYFNGTCHLRHM